MMEQTFAMIKPHAVAQKLTGKILDRIEQEGFQIIELTKMQLSREKAEKLYAIHKEQSFFVEMLTQITSGPVIVMVLQKKNAIQAWRNIMGATDPAQAAGETLRKLYGKNIGENGTHGSDSLENAKTEIDLFFS